MKTIYKTYYITLRINEWNGRMSGWTDQMNKIIACCVYERTVKTKRNKILLA